MPELPEVETIRRYLESTLVGQRIVTVSHLDARMVKSSPLPAEEIQKRLVGQVFAEMRRHGKFLFLATGVGDALLVHLGMSGRLVVQSNREPILPHTHLIIETPSAELRLTDPRRFGRIAWVPQGAPIPLTLGLEPLSPQFQTKALVAVFRGRKVAIKTALLNQSLIAGLGNIYSDEALFLARIHPRRAAGLLTEDELRRLVRSVRQVLRTSIAHRGTSFSDYVDALGNPGENQKYLVVYGQEGEHCRRCRSVIQRTVINGRSSHYCPGCQPG